MQLLRANESTSACSGDHKVQDMTFFLWNLQVINACSLMRPQNQLTLRHLIVSGNQCALLRNRQACQLQLEQMLLG
jgi:hypothetical protein